MNVERQTPRMAMEIIEREMKEQTGKLILSDCGLRKIPREVFEMDWLEELNLMNDFEDPAKRAKSKKIPKRNSQLIREPNFLDKIPKELSFLKNLKRLNIGGSPDHGPWPISDISVISSLNKLEELDLSVNDISDISPLQKLKNLKIVELLDNNISDISPLQNLKKIEILNLTSNQISNISILSFLPKINYLALSLNDISDISALKELKDLRHLSFLKNKISNLDTLKDLKRLEYLELTLNQIKDISPLGNLENLSTLALIGNFIKDIKPLISLQKIELLSLENNPIKDCPPEVWQTNDIKQIRAFFEGRTRDITSNIQQKIEIQPNVEIPSSNIPDNLDLQTRDILDGNKNFEELFDKQGQEKTTPEIDDVKLIFVGNSGAGKTQLSKFFETGKLDKKRETTHGIRLNRWLPKGAPCLHYYTMGDVETIRRVAEAVY